MAQTGTSEPGRWMTAVGELGVVGGLLTVTGWTLPLSWGWLLPCVVVLALWLAHESRLRAGATAGGPRIIEALRRQSIVGRLGVLLTLALVGAVFGTVALRAVGSLVVAFPAAWWSAGVALVFALVVHRVRAPRVQVPTMVVGVVLICVAAVFGSRYEAQGGDARGWAHSGPIHGTHPFQTTAVMVDGYGPFDLPINDFVEPDGSRGYSPQELAETMDRALQRIAEVHFADGPARAFMAFADAETGSVVDPPIRERLDRDPPTREASRFFVRSGTYGQRSSVQFVCPGRRDDPRGPIADNVMNRMCPSKYSSEGSAGLGLTGRWVGYSEGRGNERIGISRAMGWTRSDDPTGREHVRTEIRWFAWGSIVVLAALVLGRRSAVARSFDVLGGTTALMVVALAFVGVFAAGPAMIELGPITAADGDVGPPWSTGAWLAALAVFGGTAGRRLLSGEADAARTGASQSWWLRTGFAVVLVATAGVAAHLSALKWIRPRLFGVDDGALSMQRFVEGLADAIGPRQGLDILEIESVVAGISVVLLLTLALGAARTLADAAGALGARGQQQDRFRWWAVGLLVLMVFALTVSRKTEGAGTLVQGALGLSVILSSSLHRLCRPAGSIVASLAHVGWVALGSYAVILSAASSPRPTHIFVLACTIAGLLAAASALVFTRPRSAPD